MRWFSPLHLLWGLAVLTVLGAGIWSLFARRRAADRMAKTPLWSRLTIGASLEREAIRLGLLVLSLACLVLALARPQFGSRSELIKRQGVDVVVALDVSKSMLARDVSAGGAGNRLSRAKLEVSGLIDSLQGDRVGLISFSGAAFVQCPLTSDYAAAKLFLRAMEVGSIPIGGTNLGEALRVARGLFENAKSDTGRTRVVVLVSDGEDHEGAYQEELKKLTALGGVVHTIGVGTQIGELIPEEDNHYLRSQGKAVMTRLQEGTLRQLSEASGGLSMRSAAGDLGYTAIAERIGRMQKGDYEARVETVYDEQFQLPAFLAFLLLATTTLWPRREQPREVLS